MDDASMRLVVEGGPASSPGIIACSLQQTQVYDHKRHHAEVQNGTAVAGTKHFIWDFVLIRDGGSYVALHPNYSNTKVECNTHRPSPHGELPATGPGGTSGPGTFKYFIKKDVDCQVRFHAGKKVQGKGKGKGVSAGQGHGQAIPAIIPADVQPTAVADVQPTGVAQVQPSAVAEVQPAGVPEVEPAGGAEVQPTTVAEVLPTGVAEVEPTGVAEVQPTAVAVVRPTAAAGFW